MLTLKKDPALDNSSIFDEILVNTVLAKMQASRTNCPSCIPLLSLSHMFIKRKKKKSYEGQTELRKRCPSETTKVLRGI